MKPTHGLKVLSLAVLVLAGCGDDDDAHTVSVSDLPVGAYVVSVGDSSAPTVGKYYSASDGSRLLGAHNSDEQADKLYRRSAGSDWKAVPNADQDITVTLLGSATLPAVKVAAASLAGSYEAQVTAGVVAQFTVEADGDILAGASACKISGKLSSGVLPNTLALNLNTAACGSAPTSARGVLAVDSDFSPAVFRLLADDGRKLLDLLAYAR